MSEKDVKQGTPIRGLGRGPGSHQSMTMPVEKAKDFGGTLRRLLDYLKPHRIKLVITFLAAIAGTFKNMYVVAIAIFFMIVSTYQYYIIDKNLNEDILLGSNFMDMMPLLFLVLSCITLYLQWYKKLTN